MNQDNNTAPPTPGQQPRQTQPTGQVPYGQQPTLRTAPPPPQRPEKESWRNVLSTIAILIMAPIIAVLLTTYVFQSYEVDGPSMEQTLQDSDRLIVWKVPRTIARVTGNPFVPGRGEIIVFDRNDGNLGVNRQLIKRVVGLPGERVVINDGRVRVYNQANPDGFNPDTEGSYGGTTEGDLDITVPETEVFVLGDNRANSLDSRVFGSVPAEDIVGNLGIRIFPFNQIQAF